VNPEGEEEEEEPTPLLPPRFLGLDFCPCSSPFIPAPPPVLTPKRRALLRLPWIDREAEEIPREAGVVAVEVAPGASFPPLPPFPLPFERVEEVKEEEEVEEEEDTL
jgi:hypothetical protein